MKWISLVLLGAVLVGSAPLMAQTDSAIFWFSTSLQDTTPVNDFLAQENGTLQLEAWLFVNFPDWGWLGGFNFPIVFDTFHMSIDTMYIDESVWANYMFHGARWPTDTFGLYPGQAMWFASLCLSGCPQAVGTFHVGTVLFSISVPTLITDTIGPFWAIDTMMYPPSNYALVGDNTGMVQVAPSWEVCSLSIVTNVSEKAQAPRNYELKQIGPNPFNRVTSIKFSLPEKSKVNISVYDVTGRLVTTLVDEIKDRGEYTINWNGTDQRGNKVSSGTYFVRMSTDKFNSIKQLLLLR